MSSLPLSLSRHPGHLRATPPPHIYMLASHDIRSSSLPFPPHPATPQLLPNTPSRIGLLYALTRPHSSLFASSAACLTHTTLTQACQLDWLTSRHRLSTPFCCNYAMAATVSRALTVTCAARHVTCAAAAGGAAQQQWTVKALESKSIADLRALAKERGLRGDTRAELITLLTSVWFRLIPSARVSSSNPPLSPQFPSAFTRLPARYASGMPSTNASRFGSRFLCFLPLPPSPTLSHPLRPLPHLRPLRPLPHLRPLRPLRPRITCANVLRHSAIRCNIPPFSLLSFPPTPHPFPPPFPSPHPPHSAPLPLLPLLASPPKQQVHRKRRRKFRLRSFRPRFLFRQRGGRDGAAAAAAATGCASAGAAARNGAEQRTQRVREQGATS
ncbi:unnamed protein product [Closterium sp. NIES-54]